nr:hypothetical protein [Paeniglutamicibacter gangotriensis]
MAIASMINGVRMFEDMDQPTTMRVAKSITVARYSHPEPVLRYVISPTIRVPGTTAVKSRFPCSSSMWFLMCSVRASGSLTVVVFQARIRRDLSPHSFMMDPTVPAATLMPWLLRILVSWSRPAICSLFSNSRWTATLSSACRDAVGVNPAGCAHR